MEGGGRIGAEEVRYGAAEEVFDGAVAGGTEEVGVRGLREVGVPAVVVEAGVVAGVQGWPFCDGVGEVAEVAFHGRRVRCGGGWVGVKCGYAGRAFINRGFGSEQALLVVLHEDSFQWAFEISRDACVITRDLAPLERRKQEGSHT